MVVDNTPKQRPESHSDEELDAAASKSKAAGGSLEPSTDKRGETKKLDVEIMVHPLCSTPSTVLRRDWKAFLDTRDALRVENGEIDISTAPTHLQNSCLRLSIEIDGGDHFRNSDIIRLQGKSTALEVHTYVLSEEEPSTEELDTAGAGDDETTAGCDHLPLPHASLNGLWENLILEDGVKQHLLEYAQSALLFSKRGVSPHIVGWNRLLLLHGPPGTGKTSLCRALAQKLAIRLGNQFPSGSVLLEIHSHSLFSKWFSTSGKLVTRLFQVIRDMVQDDPKTLVCVLMDEVESLASARSSLGGAGEPSDAMRAVNSLLTSLDRLRSFPNVIVLATTNLTGSIDLAFVDRADVKQYVGMPILEARYEILRTCLLELVRAGIIDKESGKTLKSFREIHGDSSQQNEIPSFVVELLECARAAEGLSGRSLRRLPFQTHAQFIRRSEAVSMKEFLGGLRLGIDAEHNSKQKLNSGNEL